MVKYFRHANTSFHHANTAVYIKIRLLVVRVLVLGEDVEGIITSPYQNKLKDGIMKTINCLSKEACVNKSRWSYLQLSYR